MGGKHSRLVGNPNNCSISERREFSKLDAHLRRANKRMSRPLLCIALWILSSPFLLSTGNLVQAPGLSPGMGTADGLVRASAAQDEPRISVFAQTLPEQLKFTIRHCLPTLLGNQGRRADLVDHSLLMPVWKPCPALMQPSRLAFQSADRGLAL